MARKRLTPAKLRKVEMKVSERYFNGQPVIDAAEGIRLFVNEVDIRRAVPNDPTQCVYAQACKRLFGSTSVVFLRTKAYIDLPDAKGNRLVNRFVIEKPVREALIHFDKTGEADPGGFYLSAPSPSQRLEYQKDYSVEKRSAIRGHRTVVASIAAGVRDGRGMVHFEREDEAKAS
jgi:hypothetical protein